MSDILRIYSWWTPNGWQREQAPPAFLEVIREGGDWDQSMKRAGYEWARGTDETRFCMGYMLHAHRDGHLCLEFLEINHETTFFVAAEHAAAFMIDRYPAMASAEQAGRQVDQLERISNALIAWIRHGSGVRTVDKSGWVTRDDTV